MKSATADVRPTPRRLRLLATADAPTGSDGPLAHIEGRPVLDVLSVLGAHRGLVVTLNSVPPVPGRGLPPLCDRELVVNSGDVAIEDWFTDPLALPAA